MAPDATRRARSIASAAMGWLFLFLIVMPILELFVFVQASDAFGFLPTLLVLAALSAFGMWLVVHQSRRAWRRFDEAVASRQVPGKEIVDGTLLLVAGVLLALPGFISDAAGLLLLLPPVRALVRRLLLLIPSVRAMTRPVLLGRAAHRGWGRVRVTSATYDRDGVRATVVDTGAMDASSIDVTGRELERPPDPT